MLTKQALAWITSVCCITLCGTAIAKNAPQSVDRNDRQQYFLIGDPAESAPQDGWGVLVVLPGGDGGAGFHPFVSNIAEQWAPPGYLTVQLVALPGDPNLTWPTRHSLQRTKKQSFTTEAHLAAVLDEITESLPDGVTLDPGRRLVLGWSSGGPPAYAITTDPQLGFRGAFVAMSIFPADTADNLDADGKAFALLQSPQDRITPWSHVARAEQALTQAGAAFWKRGYAGGHGWQGDSIAKLQAGLAWLDEQVEAE
ncbi:MAG: hypothetical protein AAGK09_03905 [Planctomycetota bacterium]